MLRRLSFVRLTRKAVIAVLAVALTVGLSLVGAPAQAASSIRLTGTSSATLKAYDYCGPGFTRRLVATYVGTALATTMDLTAPKSAGGLTETNPVHFHLISGNVGSFGTLELDSAQTPLGSLQQYWSFTRNTGNGYTAGTLTNNGIATSTAINLLNGQQQLIPCQNFGSYPFTYALKTGAKMSGTLYSNYARLTFSGTTAGGEYDFSYSFSAG